MKARCLECIHLAPIKKIPEGDYREIQIGQQGMLARGLAYCGVRNAVPGFKFFRPIESSSPCPHYEPLKDKERIKSRYALAHRLQRDYAAWFQNKRMKDHETK